MNAKLTPRQVAFVAEFLVDLSPSRAAIRAGYSPNGVHVTAHRLLRKPHVAEAIEAAKAERMERSKVDADKVLEYLSAMMTADVKDIIDEFGRWKPIIEWPRVWRQMLQGCDVEELYEKATTGDKKWQALGRVVKVRFIDRLKAVELIGKHINVRAFQPDVAIEQHVHLHQMEERLKSARERASLVASTEEAEEKVN